METLPTQLQTEMTARTRLLLGSSGMERLQTSYVVVAGLGGVGGHCAEALARAGLGKLHLVDFDVVAPSNLNRQLVATKRTLGMAKTEAMRERIEDVSNCLVTVSNTRIDADTVAYAIPPDADFLVDAIDSVPGKLALIAFAQSHNIPMISCMGAGNRLDPMGFFITDIFSTSGCPLARKLRHELRKMGIPSLPVVTSSEPARTQPGQTVIGSLAPVTAAAGLCLAGYVLRQLCGEG